MQSGDKHEELVASRARIDCDRLRDDRLRPETLPSVLGERMALIGRMWIVFSRIFPLSP